MEYDELFDAASAAITRYHSFLFEQRNVNGFGVGHKIVNGQDTGVPCVTIHVTKKLPADAIPRAFMLPRFLDAGGDRRVETDILEAGPFFPEPNVTRIRPAQPGTSIGATVITAGTFGGIVLDNSTGNPLILSNNHVLANNNNYPIGGAIVQPGPHDGGVAPADTIATLLRFIPVNPTGNLVDAAVALPTTAGIISNPPLDGVPPPTPKSRCVALHFAGGDNISIGNPIQTVLTLLNIHFSEPGSVMVASIGLSVQKVGRTTNRTVGSVTIVNYTANVGGREFLNQIAFTRMTEGGDSGSLYIENP
jgi:hypothetical protein